MSKKLVSMVVSLAMVLSAVMPAFAAPVKYGAELENQPSKTYSQKFSDVPKSHWAFNYISEMAERGVLNGYPNGYFYPENNVTRGEFAKIMTLAAGLKPDNAAYSSYDDVDSDAWYHPYIETAQYYLSGYTTNGTKLYRPETTALREDIAVALVKLKGYESSNYDLSILKAMFTDWQSISEGAQKYVAIAVEKGLVSGYDDSTFRGQNGVNRAETATLLWRAYQYGNGENKNFEQQESTTSNEDSHTSKLPIIYNDIKINMHIGENLKDVLDKTGFSNYSYKFGIPYYGGSIIDEDQCFERKEMGLVYIEGELYAKKLGSAVYTLPIHDKNMKRYELHTRVDIVDTSIDTSITPSPSSTPNQVVSSKPYQVNTLTSANVRDTDLYATDDGENLYYYDNTDNVVYKLNMNSGKKTELVDLSDMKYEEFETVTETVTKTVEKKVPKTVIKEVEKAIPVAKEETDDAENMEDEDGETTEKLFDDTDEEETETIIETIEETVYETVTEEVTEEVEKEVLKGTYSDYEVQQLYYNTGNNTLLLIGKYTSYQSAKSHKKESKEKAIHYNISNGEMKYYSDFTANFLPKSYKRYSATIEQWYVYGNTSDGNLIIGAKYRYVTSSEDMWSSHSWQSFFVNFKEKQILKNLDGCFSGMYINKNNVFGISCENHYNNGYGESYRYDGKLYKYNFTTQEWESQWEDDTPCDAFGMKDNVAYLWRFGDGSITTIASDGEPKKKNIDLRNIEVLDFNNMPSSANDNNHRMFITKNESYIFYDTAAKAWRKIEKQ